VAFFIKIKKAVNGAVYLVFFWSISIRVKSAGLTVMPTVVASRWKCG